MMLEGNKIGQTCVCDIKCQAKQQEQKYVNKSDENEKEDNNNNIDKQIDRKIQIDK